MEANVKAMATAYAKPVAKVIVKAVAMVMAVVMGLMKAIMNAIEDLRGEPGEPEEAEPQVDEFAPFPVMEIFPATAHSINSPPRWPEALLLGFQHYIVMLGTSVIIPSFLVQLMGGENDETAWLIQTFLLVVGINTLLQSWLGTRLPIVIGGSFTYLLPTCSIIARFADIADPYERFSHTIRAIQGALIASSILQIILGFSGIWRIAIRFLSPLTAVPIVIFTGLGVFKFGFPLATRCVEIGLPAFFLFVALSQYAPNAFSRGRIIFDRLPVLICVGVIWAYAHVLTVCVAYSHSSTSIQSSCRTDHTGLIGASPWIRFPYPFHWGAPTFNVGDVFAMMAASFASLVESTGVILAASRFAGATFVPPSVFSRGVGWQGVGVLLSGIFGTGNGSAASVENAGLLATTRVGSRRVVEISAGFMIFFSIFGKFGSLFASIPIPIVAGLNCILYGFVAAGGLNFLQFCNINSLRTLFVLGTSIFVGFSISDYFMEFQISSTVGPVNTRTGAINDMINVIFSSPATVAGIIAYFVDSTLLRNNTNAQRDRGWQWWEKFKSYRTDRRSEEFYALPCGLDKLFPP